jgi:NAD(P)-dependent dehydrogenase (short-subunit alcohol dehydrogenase family)
MLVHNAGIASPPGGIPTKTKEGLDIMYSTNFLGSFLMTHLLEDSLSPAARVVMTSSVGSYSATAHFLYGASREIKESTPGVVARIITKIKAALGIQAESSAPAYGLSKAQQVLFADLLQQHFDRSLDYNRTAHAFSPGFTSTPIFSTFDVTWQTWFSDPFFALLKVTEKRVAVDTDEGAKTGTWLATWGAEIGKRKQGGAYWERMETRTSLVDLMNEKQKQDEWKRWEKDASTFWEI